MIYEYSLPVYNLSTVVLWVSQKLVVTCTSTHD